LLNGFIRPGRARRGPAHRGWGSRGPSRRRVRVRAHLQPSRCRTRHAPPTMHCDKSRPVPSPGRKVGGLLAFDDTAHIYAALTNKHQRCSSRSSSDHRKLGIRAKGRWCGDGRRHAATLAPAQCRHGDARGLEVSPSSLLQNELIQCQIGKRLAQPGVLELSCDQLRRPD
jgi:hypothetical protein